MALPIPIDERTAVRINLGILASLITALVGGSVYLNNLNGNVRQLSEAMGAVKSAIDRNTAQQVADGKALAILQTLVTAQDERLRNLESQKSR
ncbi:MAG: hypothetical protein KA020_08035 [Planctomycetes bacterium]|nr:hypothetical protein [Planctomycetota bacterium]